MKTIFTLFVATIVLLSCNNNIKEIEIDRTAGEWVSSGAKYVIGSDEKVAIVKKLIENYAALDAEGVFTNTRDSLRFFPFNSKTSVMLTVDNLKEMFSSYDSIISKPVYYLPYDLEGVRSIVQVTSTETKYNKNGTVEEDLLLEKFIFGKNGKIHTVRQWRAAW
ncbi:MAG: hypothetical protein C7M88_00430 [Candidatus Arcticimaribacter sp.]|nr:hypothetical protein [Flavobacteriaceae bacterium]PSR10891.1 MAG: hypothetical protein C7M88_00430 [Candidatus Arcticimaribacter sp.]